MRPDLLAVEEPLEIRLGWRRRPPASTRLRHHGTPGHDRELAVGFLFSEGILTGREQVAAIHACKTASVVRVRASPGVQLTCAVGAALLRLLELRRVRQDFARSDSRRPARPPR